MKVPQYDREYKTAKKIESTTIIEGTMKRWRSPTELYNNKNRVTIDSNGRRYEVNEEESKT